MDPLYRYFIYPIEARTGYNPVNTLTYGLLLILGLYVLRKKIGDRISEPLVLSYVPFVVFSGVLRTYEDFGLLARTYLTVSPGFYLLMVSLGLAEFLFLKEAEKIRKSNFLLLALSLLPLIPRLHPGFLLILFPLAPLFLKTKLLRPVELVFLLGVALDVSATVIGVSLCGFYEQHFIPRALMAFHPLLFPLIKIPLAAVVVGILRKEKDEGWRNLLYLALISVTLGPGTRDMVVVSGAC